MTESFDNNVKTGEMVEGKAYTVDIAAIGYSDAVCITRYGDEIYVGPHLWTQNDNTFATRDGENDTMVIHRDTLTVTEHSRPEEFDHMSLRYFYEIVYLDIQQKFNDSNYNYYPELMNKIRVE